MSAPQPEKFYNEALEGNSVELLAKDLEKAAPEQSVEKVAEHPLFQKLTVEQVKQSFATIVDAQIEMQKNIEQAGNQERGFHDLDHPLDVLKGALDFLKAVEEAHPGSITPEQIIEVTEAIAYHDAVIYAKEFMDPNAFPPNDVKGPDGKPVMLKVIKRARGFEANDVKTLPPALQEYITNELGGKGNEALSADLAETRIRELKPDVTDEELANVKKIIGVTYPVTKFPPDTLNERFTHTASEITDSKVVIKTNGESFDITKYLAPPKEGKFSTFLFDQRLSPESSLVEVAGAIGDLSYHGRTEVSEAQKTADQEFIETNPGVSEILRTPLNTVDEYKKAAAARKLIDWIASQVPFIATQALRFEDILATNETLKNDEQAKALLNAQYNKFGENLSAAITRLEDTKSQFNDLTNPETFVKDPEANARLVALATPFGYEPKVY